MNIVSWLRAWMVQHVRAISFGLALFLAFQMLVGIGFLVLALLEVGPAADTPVLDSVLGLSFGVIPLIGLLILRRMPEHAIGWLFCLIGVTSFTPIAGLQALTDDSTSTWLTWVLLFNELFDLVGVFILLLLVPLLFPSGRLLSPRWRPVLLLSSAVIVASMLDGAFTSPTLSGQTDLEVMNPLYISSVAAVIRAVLLLGYVAVPVALVSSVLSLGLRFRHSRGVERLQLRLLLWMFGVIISTLLVLLVGQVVVPDVFDLNDGLNPLEIVLGLIVLGGMGWGIPVTLGLAILRYRLYSIDLLINRTLVYGALSVGLGAIYLLVIVIFQQVLDPFTGSSDLAVAGSTLLVAGLFRPLRRHIQTQVDRRFYRRKYDAARTIAAFSTRLRDEVDLDALLLELRAVVRETMQPESVWLWLPANLKAGPREPVP